MGRPPKIRLEGELSPIDPKRLARGINAAVAYFRENYPEDWEALALCPLQHGFETMAHKLAAK